jgi:hypothetical protein
MRVHLPFLLVAALLAPLAGCSDGESPPSGASNQNASQTSQGGGGGAAGAVAGQGGAGGAGGTAGSGTAGSGNAGGGQAGSGQAGGGQAGSGQAGGGQAGAAGTSPAANCASTFGSALPPGFVRVDGTLVAIVRPQDQQCAMPNGTHVTLQVMVDGAVYRMVTNVKSDQGTDIRVRYGVLDAALPAPAWSEGFHTGVTLDYPKDLGVHSETTPFMPLTTTALVNEMVNRLPINGHVAVYSQGNGGSSTHLVHRNGSNDDGAIVIDPESSTPHFLLFHFAEQQF